MVSFLVYKRKEAHAMETIVILTIILTVLLMLFTNLGWGTLMLMVLVNALVMGLTFLLIICISKL